MSGTLGLKVSSEFGVNLRRIREMMGLTQDELAKRLGTCKQVISRYETGHRSPSMETVVEYATKLNVKISQLAHKMAIEDQVAYIRSDRLRELRLARGLTTAQVAERGGMVEEVIKQLEGDDDTIHVADIGILFELSSVLDCDFLYLVGRTNTIKTEVPNLDLPKYEPVEVAIVPLIVSVVAPGNPIPPREAPESTYERGGSFKADYAIRMPDDAMVNIGIKEGDTAFIKEVKSIDHGVIALVYLDGVLTLRRYLQYGTKVILHPENSAFEDISFSVSDKQKKNSVLGRVIAFQRDIK